MRSTKCCTLFNGDDIQFLNRNQVTKVDDITSVYLVSLDIKSSSCPLFFYLQFMSTYTNKYNDKVQLHCKLDWYLIFS